MNTMLATDQGVTELSDNLQEEPSVDESLRQDCSLNPTREFLLRHIQFDKIIVKGRGGVLTDDQGNQYLDFISQYGALPFGQSARFLEDRCQRFFTDEEPTFVQPLRAPEPIRLSQRLLALSPFPDGYCTFCNSGAESVEAAIKLARSKTGRQTIVSSHKGFHGKTLGAASATSNPNYSQPFLVDTQYFIHTNLADLATLEHMLSRGTIAAVLVELVQGEGGMGGFDQEVMTAIAKLCQRHGTLLIIDEVQTGVGRLGSVLGISEYPDVKPDIICLAKALGGGLVPLGAMLCSRSAWTESFGLYHSSTFANNNFTCAIGNAVLDRLLDPDAGILANVRTQSFYLKQELERIVEAYPAAYRAVNGRGLMLGVELAPWPQVHSYFLAHASFHGLAAPLVCGYLLNRHGILTAPVFNHTSVVRIEPNLTVQREDIDRLILALDDIGQLITERRFSSLLSYIAGLDVEESRQSEVQLSADPVLPLPHPSGRKLGSFAFLIHPTMDEDLMRIMPESVYKLAPESRSKWREWMDSWFSQRYEPAPVLHVPAVVNKNGDYVEGWLVSCPLTPEQMMRLKKNKRDELLTQYFEICEALEVDRIGLGAFTSIISRGGSRLPARSTAVTTGNSYTGMISTEGLIKAVTARFGHTASLTLSVIGAAGAVGRIAAIEASRSFSAMILFGNPANPSALNGLEEVRAEIIWRAFYDAKADIPNALYHQLRQLTGNQLSVTDPTLSQCMAEAEESNFALLVNQIEERFPGILDQCIRLSIDISRDLPHSQAVISATSNGHSFVESSWLAPGAVICDAARPPDFVASLATERPDVFAFEGGLVKLPHPIQFGKSNILGFSPEVNLACLSETIILTMAQRDGDYSIGKSLCIEQAREMYAIAQQFGFGLPDNLLDAQLVSVQDCDAAASLQAG